MASTSIAFDLIAHDRASDKFDKIGRSADSSGSKLHKFAKFAAIGLAGVAAAGVAAGKVMFDMTKAAIADEAAQKKLALQLKNSAHASQATIDSNEDYISSMGRLLGVADDDLRPALGRLVTATHDVEKAQSLSMIAMNVSAGTGKSLKTVTEALAKAQNGSLTGLAKLGVATKDAEGKTRSLEAITADLADTYAGQAATAANTTEGKFNRLKLMFDETKESIGAKLIPVATDLAEFMLTKGVPAAEKFADWFGDKIAPALKDVGDWIGSHLQPVFETWVDMLTNHVIPALQTFGEKVLNGVRGFIDNLSDSLEDNKPFLQALGDALLEVGKFVYDKVIPAIGWLAEHVLPTLGKAIGTAITVIHKIIDVLLSMSEFGVKAFRFLLDAAFDTFGGILDAADWGLSWIPGIGDKIHDANMAFHDFADRTVGALDRTANAIENVHRRIDGLPPKKYIDVGVNTNSALATLGQFQTKIDGLHGKTVTVYANILTSNKTGVGGGDLGDLLGGREHARGTVFAPGGLSLVGEEGPELVDLPRGSRVYSNQQSRAMASAGVDEGALYRAVRRALSEMPILRLPNEGQSAYLAGA